MPEYNKPISGLQDYLNSLGTPEVKKQKPVDPLAQGGLKNILFPNQTQQPEQQKPVLAERVIKTKTYSPQFSTGLTDQEARSAVAIGNQSAKEFMPQPQEPGAIDKIKSSLFESEPGEFSNAGNLGMALLQGLSAFGAGISGQSQEGVNRFFDQIRENKRMSDPNSTISKTFQTVLSRVDPSGDYRGKSANDLRGVVPLADDILKRDMLSARSGHVPATPKLAEAAQKDLDDYEKAIDSAIRTRANIKKLDRTALGKLLPDVSAETQSIANTIEADNQALIRALAGPGTIQQSEREQFGKIIPSQNMRKDTALETSKRQLDAGALKAIDYLDNLRSDGRISETDYTTRKNRIINKIKSVQ